MPLFNTPFQATVGENALDLTIAVTSQSAILTGSDSIVKNPLMKTSSPMKKSTIGCPSGGGGGNPSSAV